MGNTDDKPGSGDNQDGSDDNDNGGPDLKRSQGDKWCNAKKLLYRFILSRV